MEENGNKKSQWQPMQQQETMATMSSLLINSRMLSLKVGFIVQQLYTTRYAGRSRLLGVGVLKTMAVNATRKKPW